MLSVVINGLSKSNILHNDIMNLIQNCASSQSSSFSESQFDSEDFTNCLYQLLSENAISLLGSTGDDEESSSYIHIRSNTRANSRDTFTKRRYNDYFYETDEDYGSFPSEPDDSYLQPDSEEYDDFDFDVIPILKVLGELLEKLYQSYLSDTSSSTFDAYVVNYLFCSNISQIYANNRKTQKPFRALLNTFLNETVTQPFFDATTSFETIRAFFSFIEFRPLTALTKLFDTSDLLASNAQTSIKTHLKSYPEHYLFALSRPLIATEITDKLEQYSNNSYGYYEVGAILEYIESNLSIFSDFALAMVRALVDMDESEDEIGYRSNDDETHSSPQFTIKKCAFCYNKIDGQVDAVGVDIYVPSTATEEEEEGSASAGGTTPAPVVPSIQISVSSCATTTPPKQSYLVEDVADDTSSTPTATIEMVTTDDPVKESGTSVNVSETIPGQDPEDENPFVVSGQTTEATPDDTSNSGLSAGAIAGIVVAVIVVIIIVVIIGIVFCMFRRKKPSEENYKDDSTIEMQQQDIHDNQGESEITTN